MTETLITLLVLGIAAGTVLVYLLKFKPMQGLKVKDLYAEGLDLMITGNLFLLINCFIYLFKI